MSAGSAAISVGAPKVYRAIIWGGLIAGSMDISAAAIQTVLRGRNPIMMLQGIASGLLGQRSFQGGYATAALGLALHFLIAYTACTMYFAVSRRLTFMVTSAVLCGLLYGVLVYAFMNLVVLQLAFPSRLKYTVTAVCIGLIVHVICIGLPISLTVRWYSK
ncbi:MAG: hypothetical protein ACREDR_03545 [Blastocatellia bacterium]